MNSLATDVAPPQDPRRWRKCPRSWKSFQSGLKQWVRATYPITRAESKGLRHFLYLFSGHGTLESVIAFWRQRQNSSEALNHSHFLDELNLYQLRGMQTPVLHKRLTKW